MRLIFKTIFLIFILFFLLVAYLSTFGIETSKFNKQIQNKVEETNKDLSVELKEVKLTLNPLRYNFSIKTIGPKMTLKNQSIELESIKMNISVKSLLSDQFLIEQIELSTRSIPIGNLISFAKSIYKAPELIVLENFFRIKGYLIANINLEFDLAGNLKNNYRLSGFIKDAKLHIFENNKIDKLNFIFDISKDNFVFEDIELEYNKYNLFSKKISTKKVDNHYLVNGILKNDIIDLNEKDINFFKNIIPNFDLKKIKFSSSNNFTFNIDDRFKIKNLKLISNIQLKEAQILNSLNLKKIFPNIKKEIILKDNKINLNYKKNLFSINGKGNILIQKTNDLITYDVEKNKERLKFKKLLKIKENPFRIEYLNYEKNIKSDTIVEINGFKDDKSNIFFNSISLHEENNKIEVENIKLDSKYKIINFNEINLDYLDSYNQRNVIKIKRNKSNYMLNGEYFNADSLIDNLLFEENNSSYFSNNFDINLNLNKVRLDNEHQLANLKGNLNFKNQKLFNGNLTGEFSDSKKMNFTVNTDGNTKITTFFIEHAKPIVKRYKFVKGFEKGILDFYSSKTGEISKSTLKIYDFKLKELPTLTKILTLASLQGIADILSGEGIRFNELEMNFDNKGNLININEIYAIGPAISILMNGYIEKNKLISLRGTLVPATTINKAIGSIPVLGKILVGSKTGEGVFGVSFKIKGPPKKLETSVNPIKTLTPRFITRTLEKIKKVN